MTKTIRRLKVEPPSMTIPSQIRLKGKWLEAAGFKPNDYVAVMIEPGRLIIQIEKSASQQNPQ